MLLLILKFVVIFLLFSSAGQQLFIRGLFVCVCVCVCVCVRERERERERERMYYLMYFNMNNHHLFILWSVSRVSLKYIFIDFFFFYMCVILG
jgi:hypothetical protein